MAIHGDVAVIITTGVIVCSYVVKAIANYVTRKREEPEAESDESFLPEVKGSCILSEN